MLVKRMLATDGLIKHIQGRPFMKQCAEKKINSSNDLYPLIKHPIISKQYSYLINMSYSMFK